MAGSSTGKLRDSWTDTESRFRASEFGQAHGFPLSRESIAKCQESRSSKLELDTREEVNRRA